MIVLSPSANPEMFSLVLHDSLWRGICEDALRLAVDEVNTLGLSDADRLSVWASQCENPSGQKAVLCRSIVGLIRVGNVLGVERQLSGPVARPFWELAG
jgi:hypothetical protein